MKYTAKEKKVQRRTREGLREEKISEGESGEVPKRSRGRPPAGMRLYRYGSLKFEKSSAAEKQDALTTEDLSASGEKKSGEERKRLRDYEKIPEDKGLEGQKSEINQKQKKIRLREEQAKTGRLSFEDEGNRMIRGAGTGIVRKAAETTVSAGVTYIRDRLENEEDDNAAVEAASAGEKATEQGVSHISRIRERSRRSEERAAKREYQPDEISGNRLKFGKDEEAPSKVYQEKKKEEKRSLLNRFFQRKRYKDAYRSSKAGASAGKNGAGGAAAAAENITTKAKNALKEVAARNHAVLAVFGVIGLIFLLIATAFGSCSASIQGSGSVIGITTYPSSDEDIYAAEQAYSDLEAALNEQINQMESLHPGYDEYNYNVSEITHNPYHLISYLTAKYGDWTFEDVEDEIDELFSEQYSLHTEERTETVTETRTVRVGESIGQVVTSGYCSCAVCCGQWAGGTTASGVYPTANHTLAVDASDPIVPMGTKVVMNGVEYTVEDTGGFGRYGVDFDVYYDNHAAALAHGHQTWECYLADDNGSNEVTVTDTTTKKILYITLSNQGLDAVAREKLDEEQKILYNALNTTLGNRDYLWDTGTISGGSGGMDYDIPPEALTDERFSRMIQEAEKYLGVPYVWGGYSPSGFDCSGFVSYVVNNCGNGWNFGRMTAEGLRGQCTYVDPSEAKPGDLIFFQGTYNTSGASHIGIYVGNGMMIHCGDPVQYANINSSYWQAHFMCFGRLP